MDARGPPPPLLSPPTMELVCSAIPWVPATTRAAHQDLDVRCPPTLLLSPPTMELVCTTTSWVKLGGRPQMTASRGGSHHHTSLAEVWCPNGRVEAGDRGPCRQRRPPALTGRQSGALQPRAIASLNWPAVDQQKGGSAPSDVGCPPPPKKYKNNKKNIKK